MTSCEGCGVAKRSSRDGSVGVCGALGACKKHVKSYNTAKFDSLKDALLAGPGMRPVIGFHIFGASLQNFV